MCLRRSSSSRGNDSPVVAQLADLADVVQENAHEEQIAVQLRIEADEAVAGVEERGDVLEQTADVGVVVANAGRRPAEAMHELVVHEETLGQGAQVRVAQLHQGAAEPVEQLADVLLGVRQEVGQVDLLGFHPLQVGQDHLQGALEELHLALDEQEVADVERAEQVLAGVPQPGVHGPAAVADVELQVEVAVAVGPQLLVGHQEDFLDRLAVGQLLHETPCHQGLGIRD
jgi:hypothetical protein